MIIICIASYLSILAIGSRQFSLMANKFLEEVCCQIILWDTGDRDEADLMRKIFRTALPNMNCEKFLQL